MAATTLSAEDRLRREIKAEMGRQGRSGQSLAAELGWSDSSFSRRMTGKQSIKFAEAEQIARALKVPLGQLVARGQDAA